MKDARIRPYAELLVNHSIKAGPGDTVLIRGGLPSTPLLEELARAVYRAGAHPYVVPSWDELRRIGLSEASDEQLSTVTEIDKTMMTGFACQIVVNAPENTRSLSGVDPRKPALRAKAVQPYMSHLINNVRWVTCNYPCAALAQEADLSVEDYAEFVLGACLIDWNETQAFMKKVAATFDAAHRVRIVGAGTNLTFSIAGRTGVVCAGERNMPDGEVFYAPVEDSAEGFITYDFPAIYQGREVDGVSLKFAGGRVVDATAKKNEEFLVKTLDTDPGARIIGEFGIGCNFGITRFSKDILFDEKIGGTIHLALGRAYEQGGGSNQSAIHWDMIKDLRQEGRIELDGKVVQENGVFREM